MKRYVVLIRIEKTGKYSQYKRDVVTLLPKEKVIAHFDKLYESHKKHSEVSIVIEMELDCGDMFEVL